MYIEEFWTTIFLDNNEILMETYSKNLLTSIYLTILSIRCVYRRIIMSYRLEMLEICKLQT